MYVTRPILQREKQLFSNKLRMRAVDVRTKWRVATHLAAGGPGVSCSLNCDVVAVVVRDTARSCRLASPVGVAAGVLGGGDVVASPPCGRGLTEAEVVLGLLEPLRASWAELATEASSAEPDSVWPQSWAPS